MKKLLLALAAALLLSGCSLFKFTVSTGDTPLPASDLNTRMMTRGFYYEFTGDVIRTADSIISVSQDPEIKLRAIRWKMEATSACMNTAMQTSPDVALLDTWILCRQMDTVFVSQPDSLLFGVQTPLARKTSARLLAKIERVARDVLTPERLELMTAFVDDYCRSQPVGSPDVAGANRMLEWRQYLAASGQKPSKTVGAVSEVMADMSERFSSSSRQLGNSITWYKEMLDLQLKQDSLRSRLTMRLDSLSADFSRMVLVLQHTPEIADHISDNLARQMGDLISALNYTMSGTFENFDRQRLEIQEFIAAQRAQLMAETQTAADTVVKSAMDALPGMIGSLLVYIVAAAIVLFSLPFILGYLLGRARERKKGKNPGR